MLSLRNRLWIAAAAASLHVFAPAHADDEAADLLRLQRASQLIQAKKASDAAYEEGIVEKGIPALETLGLTRFYRPGDRWRLMFSARSKSYYRMLPLTGLEVDTWSRPIAYDFEVKRVGNYVASGGVTRRYAEIEITIADRRLLAALRNVNTPTKVTLTLNDLYRGLLKTYHFPRPREDGSRQATYSLDGRRNVSSSLGRFPIDLPNVSRADGVPATASPVLPASLQTVLGRAQVLDPASTLTFRYKNTYGKQLEVAWTDRSLWPVYTSSESGVAVLISQERAR